jgi:hypothetical protein
VLEITLLRINPERFTLSKAIALPIKYELINVLTHTM